MFSFRLPIPYAANALHPPSTALCKYQLQHQSALQFKRKIIWTTSSGSQTPCLESSDVPASNVGSDPLPCKRLLRATSYSDFSNPSGWNLRATLATGYFDVSCGLSLYGPSSETLQGRRTWLEEGRPFCVCCTRELTRCSHVSQRIWLASKPRCG